MERKTNKGRSVILRFRSKEDLDCIKNAAKDARLSVNSYIISMLNSSGAFVYTEMERKEVTK